MQDRNVHASVINAILLTILGFYLSIYSADIARSTKLFIDYLSKKGTSEFKLNGWVAFFWLLQFFSIFWVTLFLYSQSLIEEKKVTDNKEFLKKIKDEITSTILSCPNPDIFSIHYAMYERIGEIFNTLDESIKSESESKELYVESFKLILERINFLTQQFSPSPFASFCTLIMPYKHGDDDPHYIHTKINEGKVFAIKSEDMNKYFVRGLLEFDEELLFHNNRMKSIPIVNLPLLTDTNGRAIYIPGACRALVNGENVVQSTDLGIQTQSDYSDLPSTLYNRFKSFFENDGQEIRSIVSFAIPVPSTNGVKENGKAGMDFSKKPLVLGVLNVDCSQPNLLGPSPKFNDTFFSLVRPIIHQLAPYFQRYLKMSKND